MIRNGNNYNCPFSVVVCRPHQQHISDEHNQIEPKTRKKKKTNLSSQIGQVFQKRFAHRIKLQHLNRMVIIMFCLLSNFF